MASFLRNTNLRVNQMTGEDHLVTTEIKVSFLPNILYAALRVEMQHMTVVKVNMYNIIINSSKYLETQLGKCLNV